MIAGSNRRVSYRPDSDANKATPVPLFAQNKHFSFNLRYLAIFCLLLLAIQFELSSPAALADPATPAPKAPAANGKKPITKAAPVKSVAKPAANPKTTKGVKLLAPPTPDDGEDDPNETTYGLHEPNPTGDHYTSVIIDTTEFHVTTSMSPAILRTDGSKVWPTLNYIDPDYVITHGIVVYARSLEEAKGHKRAGKNPLIISATGHGKSADDPIISESDAELILNANKHNQCMDKFKVIFVLDPIGSEKLTAPGAPTPKSDPMIPDDTYTSVIIDASDLHLTRSMSPRLTRTDGTTVWPTLSNIDPDYVIEEGIVVYTLSLEEARAHQRAGNKPLVVKAASRGKNSDEAVLADEIARAILTANRRNKCMDRFRVIFILDKPTTETTPPTAP